MLKPIILTGQAHAPFYHGCYAVKMGYQVGFAYAADTASHLDHLEIDTVDIGI